MIPMKMAHIVPVNSLATVEPYTDMHLVLYHWLKQSRRYLNWMKKSKIYKMLDNSQYELRTEIDYDDLLKIAKQIKAHEIIAPDVMYKYRKTRKLIENFLPKVPKGMKIQAVVCGENLENLKSCYQWMVENERIDVIGISKHGCTARSSTTEGFFNSRHQFLDKIDEYKQPIHLLGVNKIEDYFRYHIGVRSIDGKFLAKVANDDKKIELNTKLDNSSLKAVLSLFQSLKEKKS